MAIILASGSPRRIEFMKQLGIKCRVLKSSYHEDLTKLPKNMKPADIAKHFALEKAKDVAKKKKGIIIGADIVVVLGKKILGKPKNKVDAKKMLLDLAGKTHQVITGVAIIDTETGKTANSAETTDIIVRKLSQAEIVRYIKTGESMDKAGAYGIQGHGGALVKKINGCYTNVVGFPIPLFIQMLRKLA